MTNNIYDIIETFNKVLIEERQKRELPYKGHFVESHYGKKIFGPFKTIVSEISYINVTDGTQHVVITSEYSDKGEFKDVFYKGFLEAFKLFLITWVNEYENFIINEYKGREFSNSSK